MYFVRGAQNGLPAASATRRWFVLDQAETVTYGAPVTFVGVIQNFAGASVPCAGARARATRRRAKHAIGVLHSSVPDFGILTEPSIDHTPRKKPKSTNTYNVIIHKERTENTNTYNANIMTSSPN
jgi:hypothetical protein